MRTFQFICIGFCLLGIISAITGISSVEIINDYPIKIERTDIAGRIISLIIAAAFGTFAYGIQKRAKITWIVGLTLFVFISIDFLFETLTFTLRLPGIELWIATLGCVLGFIIVFGSFGSWWIRQRTYFYTKE